MATNAYAGQAQACLIRVARLNDDGSPSEGSCNLYVTEKLVSLEWSPEVNDGDTISQLDGCGEEELFFRADDVLRWLNLTMRVVAPEPELLEFFAGGTVHNLSGDTTGYGLKGPGVVGGPTDTSIELWEAIIVDGSIADYMRYVFPRTRGWRRTGSTHENAAYEVQIEGRGFAAGAWGDGPAGDWSDLTDEPVTLYDGAIEVNSLPAAQEGCQDLVIPS